jgi:hypothetical protein
MFLIQFPRLKIESKKVIKIVIKKKNSLKKFNLSIRDRIPISYVVLDIKTFQLTAKAKQINASLNYQLKNCHKII